MSLSLHPLKVFYCAFENVLEGWLVGQWGKYKTHPRSNPAAPWNYANLNFLFYLFSQALM